MLKSESDFKEEFHWLTLNGGKQEFVFKLSQSNSADDNLIMFFIFFPEIGSDISWISKETILMKCQAYFLWKMRKLFQNVICWKYHPACEAFKAHILPIRNISSPSETFSPHQKHILPIRNILSTSETFSSYQKHILTIRNIFSPSETFSPHLTYSPHQKHFLPIRNIFSPSEMFSPLFSPHQKHFLLIRNMFSPSETYSPHQKHFLPIRNIFSPSETFSPHQKT